MTHKHSKVNTWGFWLTNVKCQQKNKQYNFSRRDHGIINKTIFNPHLKKTAKWQGCVEQIQFSEVKKKESKHLFLYLLCDN